MSKYVFSDLHGNLELFNLIMKFFEEREQAGETVEYYFLGDACDRMDDGYEIMKSLLADKRCIYIKGNHEDMLVKALIDLKSLSTGEEDFTINENIRNYIMKSYYVSEHVQLSIANGSYATLEAWIKDGMPRKFVQALLVLPNYCEVDNYTLMHAGCDKFQFEYNDTHAMIWDRDHFYENWEKGILIHGHTPVSYLPASFRHNLHHTTWSPIVYANNTKICMDTACFHTNRIFVLNLDTSEFIPFVGKNAMEETI